MDFPFSPCVIFDYDSNKSHLNFTKDITAWETSWIESYLQELKNIYLNWRIFFVKFNCTNPESYNLYTDTSRNSLEDIVKNFLWQAVFPREFQKNCDFKKLELQLKHRLVIEGVLGANLIRWWAYKESILSYSDARIKSFNFIQDIAHCDEWSFWSIYSDWRTFEFCDYFYGIAWDTLIVNLDWVNNSVSVLAATDTD